MKILIVEDDHFYANRLSEILTDNDAVTQIVQSADEALRLDLQEFESAIIDVMLPNNPEKSGISVEESRGGYLAGVAVARRLRKSKPGLKIALITGDVWQPETDQWAKANAVPLIRKYESQRSMCEALRGSGILNVNGRPRAFIVHGRDEVALLELKNYIQNTLHWAEPVILREQPSSGKTLIEKFEEFSGRVDCVFVLLTPDDSVSKPGSDARRSRQNVIFELGFFFAHFGRLTGRVLVLHKGPNELPSDIHGIVWIGIDNGVEAAGEQIRREVAALSRQPQDAD